MCRLLCAPAPDNNRDTATCMIHLPVRCSSPAARPAVGGKKVGVSPKRVASFAWQGPPQTRSLPPLRALPSLTDFHRRSEGIALSSAARKPRPRPRTGRASFDAAGNMVCKQTVVPALGLLLVEGGGGLEEASEQKFSGDEPELASAGGREERLNREGLFAGAVEWPAGGHCDDVRVPCDFTAVELLPASITQCAHACGALEITAQNHHACALTTIVMQPGPHAASPRRCTPTSPVRVQKGTATHHHLPAWTAPSACTPRINTPRLCGVNICLCRLCQRMPQIRGRWRRSWPSQLPPARRRTAFFACVSLAQRRAAHFPQ